MPFKRFSDAENGAVTVDWVVLTAALVGLGLATMAVVSSGVQDASGDIETSLRDDAMTETSRFYSAAIVSEGMWMGEAHQTECPADGGPCDYGFTRMCGNFTNADGDDIQGCRADYDDPDKPSEVTWTDSDGNAIKKPENGDDYVKPV